MAGTVNKVILVGNLGRDPEVRTFQNGGRVCNLSLATTETWKDRNTGERKERTEWHRVAVLNDALVGVCERYLRKGSKVYVEGQLETRKWQGQDGQDRYTTEVVLRPFRGELTMLDGRQGEGASGGFRNGDVNPYDAGPDYGDRGGDRNGPSDQGRSAPGDLDDEIPF